MGEKSVMNLVNNLAQNISKNHEMSDSKSIAKKGLESMLKIREIPIPDLVDDDDVLFFCSSYLKKLRDEVSKTDLSHSFNLLENICHDTSSSAFNPNINMVKLISQVYKCCQQTERPQTEGVLSAAVETWSSALQFPLQTTYPSRENIVKLPVVKRERSSSRLMKLIRNSKEWNMNQLGLPSHHSRSDSLSSIELDDEGFVTPSQEQLNMSSSFIDPKDKLMEPKKMEHNWKELQKKRSKEALYFNPRKILINYTETTSLTDDLCIPVKDLIADIQVLMIGMPSTSFTKVGNEFFVTKGLRTSNLTHDLVLEATLPFIKAGKNFCDLDDICDELCINDCALVRSMKPPLDQYIFKYQTVIKLLPPIKTILQLLKYVKPLMVQLDSLIRLLSPIPKGDLLLKRLHGCLTQSSLSDSTSFNLIAILFFKCCETYYSILNNWVFHGELHPDLFIKYVPQTSVMSRDTWLKSYQFQINDAPDFIPSVEIFECGRNVALLAKCEKLPIKVEETYLEKLKPSIKLKISNDTWLDLSKQCQCYFELAMKFNPPVPRWIVNDDEELLKKAMQTRANANQEYIRSRFEELKAVRERKQQECECLKRDMEMEIKSKLLKLEKIYNYENELNVKIANYESQKSQQEQLEKIKMLEYYHDMVIRLEKERDLESWQSERAVRHHKRLMYIMFGEENTSSEETISISRHKGGCQENIYLEYTQPGSSKELDNITDDVVDCNIRPDHNITDHVRPGPQPELEQSFSVVPTETLQTNTESQKSSQNDCDTDERFEELKKLSRDVDSADYNEFANLDCVQILNSVWKSIIIPLNMQTKLVNEKLLHLFIKENKLPHHILCFKKYFFLFDGEFANSLKSGLFGAIETKKPREILNFIFLGNLLKTSGIGDMKELSFQICYNPTAFDLTDPKVLSCLKLTYNAEWPLNYIITDKVVAKYNSIFEFILTIERPAWALEKAYFDFKNNKFIRNSEHHHHIQLQRYVMSRFICGFKQYLHIAVFESAWSKFLSEVNEIDNIEELYMAHAKYIKDIRFKCFLNNSSCKLLEQFQKIMHIILLYCETYKYSDWLVTTTGSFENQKYAKLCYTYSNFLKVSSYISYLLQNLAKNQSYDHFDNLLQSIL